MPQTFRIYVLVFSALIFVITNHFNPKFPTKAITPLHVYNFHFACPQSMAIGYVATGLRIIVIFAILVGQDS